MEAVTLNRSVRSPFPLCSLGPPQRGSHSATKDSGRHARLCDFGEAKAIVWEDQAKVQCALRSSDGVQRSLIVQTAAKSCVSGLPRAA